MSVIERFNCTVCYWYCSDTVSRSGIFCASMTAIECFKVATTVNIYQIVKSLRNQKPGAILTVVSPNHPLLTKDVIGPCCHSGAIFGHFLHCPGIHGRSCSSGLSELQEYPANPLLIPTVTSCRQIQEQPLFNFLTVIKICINEVRRSEY